MNEDDGWSKAPFVVDAWMLVVEEESGREVYICADGPERRQTSGRTQIDRNCQPVNSLELCARRNFICSTNSVTVVPLHP